MPVVTLIMWNCNLRWLPSLKGKQPVSFRKLKYLTKLFIVTKRKMNQGFSYSFEAVTIHPSRGENPFFAIRPQYPGSQKHSSLKFQSCVKTVLGHTASLHEKRVQEKVFCECWLPMIRWNCTVRESDRLAACFWQITQIFDKFFVVIKKRMKPVCFSGSVRLQIFSFHLRK